MTDLHPARSMIEVVVGFTVLGSFMTLIFCVATLRLHVEEGKIRKEESIGAILRAPVPPEHILTPAGKRRAKIAKIAAAILAVSFAVGVFQYLTVE